MSAAGSGDWHHTEEIPRVLRTLVSSMRKEFSVDQRTGDRIRRSSINRETSFAHRHRGRAAPVKKQ